MRGPRVLTLPQAPRRSFGTLAQRAPRRMRTRIEISSSKTGPQPPKPGVDPNLAPLLDFNPPPSSSTKDGNQEKNFRHHIARIECEAHETRSRDPARPR